MKEAGEKLVEAVREMTTSGLYAQALRGIDELAAMAQTRISSGLEPASIMPLLDGMRKVVATALEERKEFGK